MGKSLRAMVKKLGGKTWLMVIMGVKGLGEKFGGKT